MRMHYSVISAVVDLFALWRNLSLFAAGYLLLLTAVTVQVSVKCSLLFLKRRDFTAGQVQTREGSLQGAIFQMFFLFGIVLANEVFGALKGAALSAVSLSEIPLYKTLESPTTLAFLVFATLFVLQSMIRVTFAIIGTRLSENSKF